MYPRRPVLPVLAALALAGCAGDDSTIFGTRPAGKPVEESAPATPAVPPPPAAAQTAEDFDTTTEAERRAAAAPAAGGRLLGRTVGALGDVREGGFWLKTPLVSTRAKGRVVSVETGKAAEVDLIPVEGGSQLSLAAMRLLGLGLTDLPQLEVYTR